jgi:hypothetical protein
MHASALDSGLWKKDIKNILGIIGKMQQWIMCYINSIIKTVVSMLLTTVLWLYWEPCLRSFKTFPKLPFSGSGTLLQPALWSLFCSSYLSAWHPLPQPQPPRHSRNSLKPIHVAQSPPPGRTGHCTSQLLVPQLACHSGRAFNYSHFCPPARSDLMAKTTSWSLKSSSI